MKKGYYVYVYIDPRNLNEFYYGKGLGNRKFSHLKEDSDSVKAKTIKSIQQAGLEPIIRVVAKNLTEEQALLIEKTLIWKLGRNLTNVASGHFADNFRPHNHLHKDLYGFDYENALYYVNVGEGDHRSWDDCRKYGFISAGQNWDKWGQKMYLFEVGDLIAAYLSKSGYVGIGRVKAKACPAHQFKFKGKLLSNVNLIQPKLLCNNKEVKDQEHIVAVDWLATSDRHSAKYKTGIFTYPSVVASLEEQPKTIQFLEKEFKVDFKKLLNN